MSYTFRTRVRIGTGGADLCDCQVLNTRDGAEAVRTLLSTLQEVSLHCGYSAFELCVYSGLWLCMSLFRSETIRRSAERHTSANTPSFVPAHILCVFLGTRR